MRTHTYTRTHTTTHVLIHAYAHAGLLVHDCMWPAYCGVFLVVQHMTPRLLVQRFFPPLCFSAPFVASLCHFPPPRFLSLASYPNSSPPPFKSLFFLLFFSSLSFYKRHYEVARLSDHAAAKELWVMRVYLLHRLRAGFVL